MNFVRSLLFALAFYPVTALLVLLAFPAALFGHAPVAGVTHAWVAWHHWCARFLLGIRVVVEGPLPQGSVLVAAKHQSMFETLEFVRLLHEPATVLKRELAEIPAWGWVAKRYGMIPVDRAGGATALRAMMRAAHEAVAARRPILIYPEGTRVAPGERPPLQPGFAGLYRALKLPVVPVALDSGKLWPRNSFMKQPGVVTFRFGEPIPPGLDRQDIETRVHEAINLLDV